MEIRYQRFVRSALTPDEIDELAQVDGLAAQLSDHLRARVARAARTASANRSRAACICVRCGA